MPLDLRRTQLAVAVGTAGTYNAAVEVAANAETILYDAIFKLGQDFTALAPMRESLGAVTDVPGKYIGEITFRTPVKGSGAAGTAPAYDVLHQIAALSSTVNSGSASIGSVVTDPANIGTVTPVVAGTNVNTENGELRITVVTVTTDTSVLMRCEFRATDGSPYEQEDITQSAAGAVTLVGTQLSGVTIDLGDPSASTTGMVEGDRFFIQLTAAASAQVDYVPISTAIPVADVAFFEDGRKITMHSCQANLRMVGQIGIPMWYEYRLMGIVNTITDDVILTGIQYDNVAPVAFMGVTTTLHGGTPECYTNLIMDLGLTLAPRECATEASGHKAVRITGRRTVGEIDPEGAVVATFDAFNKMIAGTTGNLIWTLGSVSGNIVTCTANIAQILSIDEAERLGIRVDRLGLLFAEPRFDAGGNYEEFTLVVK